MKHIGLDRNEFTIKVRETQLWLGPLGFSFCRPIRYSRPMWTWGYWR